MQDIRDELAHCIGALEGDVTREVANDVIRRLLRVHSDLSKGHRAVADNPGPEREGLEDDMDLVFFRLRETAAALHEMMQNPNLHPSVKALADTIAINLQANPTTDEGAKR